MPDSTQSLDIIETRLEVLEKLVYSGAEKEKINESVVSLLNKVNDSINAALKSRDSIISILTKMPTLNKYLNPAYDVSEKEMELRRQYVLEVYPELKQIAEEIKEFQRVKNFVDFPALKSLDEKKEKVDLLCGDVMDTYKEANENTKKCIEAVQLFNELLDLIKVLCAGMDQSLSELEGSLQKKTSLRE